MEKHRFFCKVREGWRWSPLEHLASFPGTPAFVNTFSKDRNYDIKTAFRCQSFLFTLPD
jgi:hypothetical protein